MKDWITGRSREIRRTHEKAEKQKKQELHDRVSELERKVEELSKED